MEEFCPAHFFLQLRNPIAQMAMKYDQAGDILVMLVSQTDIAKIHTHPHNCHSLHLTIHCKFWCRHDSQVPLVFLRRKVIDKISLSRYTAPFCGA